MQMVDKIVLVLPAAVQSASHSSLCPDFQIALKCPAVPRGVHKNRGLVCRLHYPRRSVGAGDGICDGTGKPAFKDRRARNVRLHHRHPGRVIMRNRSPATEGSEPRRSPTPVLQRFVSLSPTGIQRRRVLASGFLPKGEKPGSRCSPSEAVRL
jgi:hypothetical protein